MKIFKLLITISLIFSFYCLMGQQPSYPQDTVVVIINKHFSKTDIRYKKQNSDGNLVFKIVLDCKYYGGNSFDAAILEKIFEDTRRPIEVCDPEIKIAKSDLKKYILVNDSWITNEGSLSELRRKVSRFPWDKANYVIFKEDQNCLEKDSLTLHQVSVGFYLEED